jgi:hypothetical protein
MKTYSKRTKIGHRRMTYAQFAALAREAHELQHYNRGDRYATYEEMEMHRNDPLAMGELVYQHMANVLDVSVDDVKAAIQRVR